MGILTGQLSLYLLHTDWKKCYSYKKSDALYKLRVLNHSWLKDVEKQARWTTHSDNFIFTLVLFLIFNLLEQIYLTFNCFLVISHWSDSDKDWGFASFISLWKYHEPGNGYFKDGTLIVEVEFDEIYATKVQP